jgi:transposase-like protein
VGDLGPIRMPRLRVDGQELRLVPRQVRRIESLDEMTAEATIAGISQRRMGGWMRRATDQSLSAATVGRIVLGLAEHVEGLRHRPLVDGEFAALALDGVWGRYRGEGEAVLATALGVRWDGSFDPLDWEAGRSESQEVYERLLSRLWERGLHSLRVVVGDGAGAMEAARQVVYPEAEFQLCLWHWQRTLRALVAPVNQRRFSRDFWEVYAGLDLGEVNERARRFRYSWHRRAPEMIRSFRHSYTRTLPYLGLPARWRHRVRTVNLAEGFFRNFGRFFHRFPGLKDEGHFVQVMGLYVLGARPYAWRGRRHARAA